MRTETRRFRTAAVTTFSLWCVLVSLLTSCAHVDSSNGVSPISGPSGVAAEADEAYPADRIADWRDHGGALASFTVTGEARVAPSPDEIAAGEGVVGRDVAVRIDSRYWQKADYHTLPDSFSFSAGGWVFGRDKPETALRVPGCPWFVVGHRYVAVLAFDSRLRRPWTVLGCAAVAPYDEGRIGEGEVYDGKGSGDFARFTGQDGQAVATALTAAGAK